MKGVLGFFKWSSLFLPLYFKSLGYLVMAPSTPWLTDKQLSLIWKLTCWFFVASTIIFLSIFWIKLAFLDGAPPLAFIIIGQVAALFMASFYSGIFYVVVTVGLALVMAIRRKLPVRTEVTFRKKLTVKRK